MATTKWTVEAIREKLLTSDTMLERSLLIIYSRQTMDEKLSEETSHHNRKGFTPADARLLSSFAKQIQTNKYNKPEGERLSIKQREWARKKMEKYAGQLLRYLKEKEKSDSQIPLGVAA